MVGKKGWKGLTGKKTGSRKDLLPREEGKRNQKKKKLIGLTYI